MPIWGDAPPASANGTLQTYVSRLRRIVEPAGGELAFDETGYRLVVDPDDVDLHRFERLADRGHALLGDAQPAAARDLLLEADALWRGPVLADLVDIEGMLALSTRLEERRLAALEDRFAADLLLGRHATVGAELAEVVALHPLRENLQHQLALALYRSGRQADALRALNEAASTLREELGIEPSRQLRDLESAILAHDPGLELPTPGAPAADVGEPVFTGLPLEGRDAELRELSAALGEARPRRASSCSKESRGSARPGSPRRSRGSPSIGARWSRGGGVTTRRRTSALALASAPPDALWDRWGTTRRLGEPESTNQFDRFQTGR